MNGGAALRIGSLFSGYGGLDMAVQSVLGGSVAWHCEYEPPTQAIPRSSQAAAQLLEHRYPDVPNLGDISAVNWSQVEPVDILTGGFPCTDLSLAGLGLGLRPGTRSGLWLRMAFAIEELRPELVVIENVRGLLSADAACDVEPCPWCLGDDEGRPLRALGAVLGDLACIGYDARWCGLRAADVGAPHGRFRVFVVAWPAGSDPAALGRRAARGDDGVRVEGLVAGTSPRYPDSGDLDGRPAAGFAGETGSSARPAADTDRIRPVRGGRARGGRPGFADDRFAAAHPASDGRGEGWTESAGLIGGHDVALGGSPVVAAAVRDGREGRPQRHVGAETQQPASCGGDAAGRVLDWGDYGPAIRRWELILGRAAPAPTQTGARGGQQLSPPFVEWMMGLPEGHVTDVPGLSRNDQLRLLGNGVLPAQASAALRWLLATDLAVAA